MKFLLGTKIEMTRVFDEKGKMVPVTLIEAGPVVVTQIKFNEKDGYAAIQVGYGEKKKISKPLKGHLKDLGRFRWIREFRLSGDAEGIKVGDKMDASIFSAGENVILSGVSKGKGFQGVVKRHGFAGGPKTHGNKQTLRAPGSIGSQFPQHVVKGRRMAGRMGRDKVTKRGVEIIRADKDSGIIALKGAVPGARGSLVEIIGL